jgi:capsule polysaccharide export protein KpsE/RkpR
MGVAIEGVCDICEEEMGIQHILYTCMKFTRPRLTCDYLDKQIPLKAIYEKRDTATREEIIKIQNVGKIQNGEPKDLKYRKLSIL